MRRMAASRQTEASVGRESSLGLSVVVPLYRDEDALDAIFDRCEPLLRSMLDGGELVLVDDGGGVDRTTQRAAELADQYPHPVTIVRLARNFGQHPAVFAGLAHSRGELVATLDSDLQYPPEELPKLMAAVSPEFPVASGYRAERRDPFIRKWITRGLTRWLNARTGANLRDFGSMFRVYDRRTVDLMLTVEERHRYVPAVVAWLGVPIKEVPITHESRGESGSRYRLGGLIDLLLDLVTGYSVSPLRLLIGFGLLGSAIGFLATLGFVIYRIFEGNGVSGTTSAFALVFALLGIQLLLIALIGEYVGRIYTESKGRPYYLVGEVIESQGVATAGVGRAV
jgi:undecaprenyl-phosphate 4-deoxy-4-formamido-L-arabinose transferase